jgi:hypothetical protein
MTDVHKILAVNLVEKTTLPKPRCRRLLKHELYQSGSFGGTCYLRIKNTRTS